MTVVDTTGLDRADVLAALYNRAQPQGMGFLHYTPENMTRGQAQSILDRMDEEEADSLRNIRDTRGPGYVLTEYETDHLTSRYFDYLKGRVMKIDVSPDILDARLYDRDNGPGAAESAISTLRAVAA